MLEKKNSWVLPEISQRKVERDVANIDKRKTRFSSINNGGVPSNWRSMKNLPEWNRQKYSLKEKFGESGWNPKKKLSREMIERIKTANQTHPELNAKVLSQLFNISPELMRRILKSSFKPSKEESDKISQRWVRRGQRHLQYKLINDITLKFIDEKKLEFSEVDMGSTDEVRDKITKKLTGKDDILKP